MREKLMKLKDGLRGNQGFTIIELLTSLMIFAFFGVALLQYMMTASSIHSTVNSNVNLEIKALATLGTIEEYTVDASASVFFDTKTDYNTLYIVNNKGYDSSGTGCTVHGFRFHKSGTDKGQLQYLTMDTSTPVYKTLTTESRTYHYRTIMDDTVTPSQQINVGYLQVETVTYTSSSDAYSTDKKFYAYTSGTIPEDVTEATTSGGAVASAVPVLSPGGVEKKSYESTSSVVFSGINLGEYSDDDIEVLTSEMTNFEADLIKDEEGKILQVDLTFGMANTKDTYEKVASIMLRNTPPETETT